MIVRFYNKATLDEILNAETEESEDWILLINFIRQVFSKSIFLFGFLLMYSSIHTNYLNF